MSQNEEEQMRQAIEQSLRGITQSPPRQYPPSPHFHIDDGEEEVLEDFELQRLIEASFMASEAAQNAADLANSIVNNRPSHKPTTEDKVMINTTNDARRIIEEQNQEYEEALRIDRENAERARAAADAAIRAAEEAVEAARAFREAQAAELLRQAEIAPPTLVYSVDADVVMLNFRIAQTGKIFNHKFNQHEPMESILQQLRYDTKHLGDFKLSIGVGRFAKQITCEPSTPITDCGLGINALVNVSLI